MATILFWVGALVLFTLLRPFLRWAIVTFTSKEKLEAIGRKAVMQQPQSIHLAPLAGPAWKNPQAIETMCQPLRSVGFQDAGDYAVNEMPGVLLRFLQHPDRTIACVYEHPKARGWIDLVCKYVDNTSITFTSAQSPGLSDERPGVTKVRMNGATGTALWHRCLKERPAGEMKTYSRGELPGWFEQAFAEDIAWRRQTGVKAEAVRHVGLNPIQK